MGDYRSEGRRGGGPMRGGPRSFSGGGPMRGGPGSFSGGGPMGGGPGSFSGGRPMRGGPGSFNGGGPMRGGSGSFRGGPGRVGPYPPQSKQQGPIPQGDWVCPACSNVNWARRAQCNGKRGECKEQRKSEYVSQGDHGGAENMAGYGQGEFGNGGGGNGGYGGRGYGNGGYGNDDGGYGNDNGGYGNDDGGYGNDNGGYGNDIRGYGNGMSGFGNFDNRGQGGNMMGRGGGGMMGGDRGMMGGGRGMMRGGGGMMGGGGVNMMGGDRMGGGMMRGGGMYGGGVMMGGRGGCMMDNFGGGRGGESQVIGRKLRKPNAPPIKSGDWECPRCYNVNFHYRDRCYGKKETEQCNLKKPNFQQYKVETIKPYAAFKANDWDCWICGEVNFASKSECFKCSVDKKDAQDEALRE